MIEFSELDRFKNYMLNKDETSLKIPNINGNGIVSHDNKQVDIFTQYGGGEDKILMEDIQVIV